MYILVSLYKVSFKSKLKGCIYHIIAPLFSIFINLVHQFLAFPRLHLKTVRTRHTNTRNATLLHIQPVVDHPPVSIADTTTSQLLHLSYPHLICPASSSLLPHLLTPPFHLHSSILHLMRKSVRSRGILLSFNIRESLVTRNTITSCNLVTLHRSIRMICQRVAFVCLILTDVEAHRQHPSALHLYHFRCQFEALSSSWLCSPFHPKKVRTLHTNTRDATLFTFYLWHFFTIQCTKPVSSLSIANTVHHLLLPTRPIPPTFHVSFCPSPKET